MHSAGPALRLRPRRSALRQERPATVAGAGPDLRAGRHPGGDRRRLGGAGLGHWAHHRPDRAGGVRCAAAVSGAGRPRHPPGGGARRAADRAGERRGETRQSLRRLVLARHCHGAVVGAVRRTDPRPGADGGGAEWRQPVDDAGPVRLCAWGGDLAGARPAGRRARLCHHEKVAACRRMGAQGPGRRRADRRRRHRYRRRHQGADQAVAGRHLDAGAGPARSPVAAKADASDGHIGRPRADARHFRRHRVDQFPTPDAGSPARQGRPGRFLDLFVHQLPALTALYQGVGRHLSRPGVRRHWRPRPRVRLRARPGQCAQGGQGSRHHLSGGHR